MRRHSREARQRFGEWLDITLDNRGIAGRTLAEAMGVNDSTVSRIRGGGGTTMEVVTAMSGALGLDPIRLAVTAGLTTLPGVEPYPMPEPTARREAVRRQISGIRGLSDTGRAYLLEAYDDVMSEEKEGTA